MQLCCQLNLYAAILPAKSYFVLPTLSSYSAVIIRSDLDSTYLTVLVMVPRPITYGSCYLAMVIRSDPDSAY